MWASGWKSQQGDGQPHSERARGQGEMLTRAAAPPRVMQATGATSESAVFGHDLLADQGLRLHWSLGDNLNTASVQLSLTSMQEGEARLS